MTTCTRGPAFLKGELTTCDGAQAPRSTFKGGVHLGFYVSGLGCLSHKYLLSSADSEVGYWGLNAGSGSN